MTGSKYLSIDQCLSTAAQQMQLGKLEYAREILEQVLSVSPENADALHLISMVHYHEGNLAKAINACKTALKKVPDSVALLNNMGNFMKAAGDMTAAKHYYSATVAIDTSCFPALYNLGIVLDRLGDSKAAVASYKAALRLKTDFADLHYNMALALHRLGLLDDAADSATKALKLMPDHAEALCELGSIQLEQGKSEAAAVSLRKALHLSKDEPTVLNNLGVALTASGAQVEAIRFLRKAVKNSPQSLDARKNLALALLESGEILESLHILETLRVEADSDSEISRALAQALTASGRIDRAITLLQESLDVKSDDFESWLDLGIALVQNGDIEEAHSAFEKASELKPFSMGAAWGRTMTHLRCFFENGAEIDDSFSSYESAIQKLAESVDDASPEQISEAVSALGCVSPFYLILHNRDLKTVQETFGRLAASLMEKTTPTSPSSSAKVKRNPSDERENRVKVGIVSHFFNNHTVWKILTKGWLSELDRDKFDVFAYSTGGAVDGATEEARYLADEFKVDVDVTRLAKLIAEDRPDVLIYPSVGMDAQTLKLASMRLAPVQYAGYGHPVTTGLPTIDYFLGSDLLEPTNGLEHYSEKLVRLPGLGSKLELPLIVEETESLERLGFDSNVPSFLCLQNLHKYLPEQDDVFARIAQAVPDAKFYFARGESAMANRLKERLAKSLAEKGLDSSDHLVFLPTLSHGQYFGLCSIGDVYLDTFVNSGLMTTLEAMLVGAVPITMPGEYMRSIQTARLLEFLGAGETIASDIDSYVELAAKLATDVELRSSLRARISDGIKKVFEDDSPIASLEQHILSVV